LFFDFHVNFQTFIVICPKDCWKAGSTQVFGLAIHPEEASICRSALVDNSMPLTGGIVGVGITYGLPGYQAGK
jgi:LCCL domain